MKRICGCVLAILLFLGSVFPVLASDAALTASPVSVEVPAKSGILMDACTGAVLYENNAHAPMAPASITKIMTLLLTMEALESGALTLEEPITASAHAASMGGSQIWLEEGEVMTVHELLKATAIASANDAAMALAEHIGGSEEGFVAMMNQKAAELGMQDTVFQNPTGLDAAGHHSSAYDVALMSRALLGHEQILDYSTVWMDHLRDGRTELVNTNKLVRLYRGCTGLKTGTTDDAGSCVSASATRDGLSLIAVVMGCSTSNERFSSARRLLDYGFAGYSLFTPSDELLALDPLPVTRGIQREVSLTVQSSGVVIPKGSASGISAVPELPAQLEAPIACGQVVGKLHLRLEEKEIASFDIVAGNAVEKRTFFSCFKLLLGRLFGSRTGDEKIISQKNKRKS